MKQPKLIVPDGLEYMPFQKTGIRWAMTRPASLIADEMGLGKTVQAIGVINSTKARKVLIVCPASVKLNWRYELEKWLATPLSIHVVTKRRESIPPADVILINYDLLIYPDILKQLNARKYAIGICDEAHYLKNPKSKRTKAVYGRHGIIRQCVFKILLTGTPVLNRPIELFPMLSTLAPDTIAPHSTYMKYARKFCNAWSNGLRLEVRGHSNLPELNTRLTKDFMICRKEADVMGELPPRRYQFIKFIPEEGIRQGVNILEEATKKDFKHKNFGVSLGEIAELRRVLAESKIEKAEAYLTEILQQTDKLVIFFHHKSVRDKIIKLLQSIRKEYVVVDGDVPSANRYAIVQKFVHRADIPVFLGQIQAAGQGIDGLQKVCHNIIFMEIAWTPGEIAQAIKRVHRWGQAQPVLIKFLIWDKSIEEHMVRTVLDKTEVIRKITKGAAV